MRYYIRIRIWLCSQLLKMRCAYGLLRPQKTCDENSPVIFRIRIRGSRTNLVPDDDGVDGKSLNSPGSNRHHIPILQAIIEDRIGRRMADLRLLNAQLLEELNM
ncbi:PREDICTED: 60S ribosomal protein L15-like [Drosophila arizonae]|uniref:60S ribosomal protein L15-like n=1 Tax=Drosophila arizonae TaxID=7263 RepID=A0ABM1PBU4_DROAR|nr:PREDICTED: 60S ribosomal protein L15-like [Drosophila arizonae]